MYTRYNLIPSSEFRLLDNLKSGLILIEKGEELFFFEDEDDEICEDFIQYEIYADPINNNVIFSMFQGFEGEERVADVLDNVSVKISTSAYDYVIRALNENMNTLVMWSNAYYETSRYAIYYDIVKDYSMGYQNTENLIDSVSISNEKTGFGKYREIKNGVARAIEEI